MVRGDLCGAVRYLTEWDQGGILFCQDTDKKTGNSVLETLKLKHPDDKTPEASTIQIYPKVPIFHDINVTEDVVESMV
jgi:hypothetical protein